MTTISQRLTELGVEITPFEATDGATFVHAVKAGSLVFTSGQAPESEGDYILGHVGDDVSLEEAQEAAKRCAINTLRAVVSAGIQLDDIEQIVHVKGMVNHADDFRQFPAVIDGASSFFLEVFGDKGRHSRTAVGMALPFNIAVELELVVKLR